MCIRDSLRAVVHDGVIANGGRPVNDRPTFDLDLVAQVDRCLLYTSDAADERSRVALGGRRIIKQKYTRTTRKSIAESDKKAHKQPYTSALLDHRHTPMHY